MIRGDRINKALLKNQSSAENIASIHEKDRWIVTKIKKENKDPKRQYLCTCGRNWVLKHPYKLTDTKTGVTYEIGSGCAKYINEKGELPPKLKKVIKKKIASHRPREQKERIGSPNHYYDPSAPQQGTKTLYNPDNQTDSTIKESKESKESKECDDGAMGNNHNNNTDSTRSNKRPCHDDLTQRSPKKARKNDQSSLIHLMTDSCVLEKVDPNKPQMPIVIYSDKKITKKDRHGYQYIGNDAANPYIQTNDLSDSENRPLVVFPTKPFEDDAGKKTQGKQMIIALSPTLAEDFQKKILDKIEASYPLDDDQAFDSPIKYFDGTPQLKIYVQRGRKESIIETEDGTRFDSDDLEVGTPVTLILRVGSLQIKDDGVVSVRLVVYRLITHEDSCDRL